MSFRCLCSCFIRYINLVLSLLSVCHGQLCREYHHLTQVNVRWVVCGLFQSLAAHSRDAARSDVAGGPPPFIPFGQRGKVDNASKRGV